ncbi:CAP domain-containing protein [Thermocoleostomius sinensis]|uniref:CAP domain-containing protein n=1 Tax=Thermocoleostomius sinensis A174 TaxID=2016057 RepID=A0A9E9C9Z8_9CYAN|nr:CAP domain-containing protein [Thermocoleostomius sinensis]WAL60272.1 CAP domain-containing protein [Thermocoleostomius sinensis A174]
MPTQTRQRATSNKSRRVWLIRWLWPVLALGITGCEPLSQWVEQLPDLPDLPTAESPQVPAPVQSPETAEIEAQIRQRINEIRLEQGLTDLQQNDRLAEVARRYSQRMAEQAFFSHTSPDGDTPAQRVQSAGIRYWMVGENLFRSSNIPRPVDAAVEGWMESPGHRENILRAEYRETGIGVWRHGSDYYITQLFLRSFSF